MSVHYEEEHGTPWEHKNSDLFKDLHIFGCTSINEEGSSR